MASIGRWVALCALASVLVGGALAGCGGAGAPSISAEDVWARPSMAMPAMGGETEAGMEGGMEAGPGTMPAESGAGMTGEMNTDPATGATGAVFMKLANRGGDADKLVGAESDVATTVELHRSTMTDGVMKMSPVPDIPIPANGEVVLKPGDYHIMLLGLKRDLNVGDEFDVTLRFEKSQPQSLKVVVREQ